MAEPGGVEPGGVEPGDIGSGDIGSGGGRRLPLAPLLVAVIAVALGLLFWVLLAADAGRDATADTPLLDRPAPAAVGAFEDGAPFDLSRRKGSWVVLNFFTHDCVPCIREHPELVAFVDQQRSLGLDGAEFYSIVQTSTRDEVADYFAEYGGDWPVVFDDEYDFQIEFGVVQVPETWIIDPAGIVRGRVIGEIEADFLSNRLQSLREMAAGTMQPGSGAGDGSGDVSGDMEDGA